MKTSLNLGFATLTIETKPNAISKAVAEFIDSTFHPGDSFGLSFGLVSAFTVVGGGLLAWFA